jgi:hypothetical protein
VDRASAIALLDELHRAQNAFYAGGESAPLRKLITPDITSMIAGRERSWSTVGVYDTVAQSRITSCWLLPFDQREFDAIWSR